MVLNQPERARQDIIETKPRQFEQKADLHATRIAIAATPVGPRPAKKVPSP